MEMIFYADQDEQSGRYLIVEEDKHSISTYLTLPNKESIEKHCFLGSRVKITLDKLNIREMNSSRSPQMIVGFSNENAFMPNLTSDVFSVDWIGNGNVVLMIGGIPFLFFIEGEEKGFSRSIAVNGIYGNKWSEDKLPKKS